jgi:hypothetical protein
MKKVIKIMAVTLFLAMTVGAVMTYAQSGPSPGPSPGKPCPPSPFGGPGVVKCWPQGVETVNWECACY